MDYFLNKTLRPLSFEGKILSSFQPSHIQYGAKATHSVKILVCDLEVKVLYHKHLGRHPRFLHLLMLELGHFRLIGPREVLIKKEFFFIIFNSFLVIKFLYFSFILNELIQYLSLLISPLSLVRHQARLREIDLNFHSSTNFHPKSFSYLSSNFS